MAATKIYRVTCDVPQCLEERDAPPEGWNATRARQAVQIAGWHQSGGKDICPEHWQFGYRYGRDGWTVG